VCQRFSIELKQRARQVFSKALVSHLYTLNEKLSDKTADDDFYVEFTKKFGTHYAEEIILGSRYEILLLLYLQRNTFFKKTHTPNTYCWTKESKSDK